MKHKFRLRSVIIVQLLVGLCFSLGICIHRKHRLNSALFLAARVGNAAEVRDLVTRGASVDATDEIGYSALFYAVLHKHDRVTMALLDLGADPNIATPGALTALGQAIAFRNTEVIGALLQHGADVNANHNSDNDCVDLAMSTNDERVIQMIETWIGSLQAQPHDRTPAIERSKENDDDCAP